MRLRRVLIGGGVAAILVAATAVAAFDRFWLAPRVAQVLESTSNGAEEERDPPPEVARLVLASEPLGLAPQVARIVISQSAPEFRPPSMFRWHIYSWLAQKLIPLHLSAEQQLSVYCSRIYVGEASFGLAHAAHRLYARPLSALSSIEAAHVAALPRSPDALLRDRDRLSSFAARLIERDKADL